MPTRTRVPGGLRSALPWLLLAAGAGLRLWQYCADTSLWYDELSIAHNLHDRSLRQLMLEPLGGDQMAPLGFLAAVKICSILLGSSDLALRLVPLFASLAGLVVFWRVAVRTLEEAAAPIALALAAIAMPLVRWSTELKQYSLDVLVLLALTALALDLRAAPPTRLRCFMAGLAGLVAVAFSQAAVLALAGLGAALTLSWLLDRGRRESGPVAITVPLWVLSCAAGLAVAVGHARPETLIYMHAFWRSRGAFLPWPLKSVRDLSWIWERLTSFFTLPGMLGYPAPQFYSLLAIAGAVIVWRKRRDVGMLLAAPLLVTLAAAIVQQYPFRQRMVLFLVPGILLWLAAAAASLGTVAARGQRALGLAMPIVLLCPALLAIWKTPPPYQVEPYKSVLRFLQANRRAGDAVYVFANAYQAMTHYGPAFGLSAADWVAGACDQQKLRVYLADVDQFRGRPRVWIIGSAVPTFHAPRQAQRRYLEAIGIRRASFFAESLPPMEPISAELYDLSDANRPGAATPASFPEGPIEVPAGFTPLRCNDRVGARVATVP